MIRRPPTSTRTDTLFPYTTLFRSVSSIQVLKGPQGTLFGRNATAGGILIYSAPPTYKLEGYLDAHLGNFMDRGFEGAINLPIVDQKRSDARRVGKECVSTCKFRWATYH